MGRKDEKRLREVGIRIAEARETAGLTQKELAEKIGMSERTILNYETGTTSPWGKLREIAAVLDADHAWLAAGEASSLNHDGPDVGEELEAMREELRTIKALLLA